MTVGAAVECGHGFVGRADLYLHEVRALVSALLAALWYRGLAGTYPRVFPTENVVYLFSLELHGLLKSLLHDENVGARLAIEAEI